MSEGSGSVAKVIALAGITVGVVLAAGYVGFDLLKKEINAEREATRRVVIELKDQTISEIRAIGEQTVAEVKGAGGGSADGGAVTKLSSDVAELKKVTEMIRAEQKQMSDGLAQLLDAKPMMAKAPRQEKEELPPGVMRATIYFPLGVAKGPEIDKRLAVVLPKLEQHAAGRKCPVAVEGFSDTLGNDEKNLVLSRARATHVAFKLKRAGFNIVAVKGWGERRLKEHTGDGVKNPENRRVVVEMTCGEIPQPTEETS